MSWLQSLYPEIRRVLKSSLPVCWTELQVVLEPLLEKPLPPEVALPLSACKAVGGKPEDAIHVTAAVLAFAASLRILDDLVDQDKPGQLWEKVGSARAWNYASAVHVLCFEILSKAPLSTTKFHQINQTFIDSYFCIAAGQDRDLTGMTTTIEDYWKMIEMKSGYVYASACAIGAMTGTQDPNLIQACGVYGHHLGLAIQILNDMESIWLPNGTNDLVQGKVTLPLLYGLQTDHFGRDELLSFVADRKISTYAERIRAILDKIDTRSFLIWAALQERGKALEALESCPDSEGQKMLERYITGMFGDIDTILEL